jgi:hypothetical protein
MKCLFLYLILFLRLIQNTKFKLIDLCFFASILPLFLERIKNFCLFIAIVSKLMIIHKVLILKIINVEMC